MSCILLRTVCEADLHMDGSFNELIYSPVLPGGGGGEGSRHRREFSTKGNACALVGEPLKTFHYDREHDETHLDSDLKIKQTINNIYPARVIKHVARGDTAQPSRRDTAAGCLRGGFAL